MFSATCWVFSESSGNIHLLVKRSEFCAYNTFTSKFIPLKARDWSPVMVPISL